MRFMLWNGPNNRIEFARLEGGLGPRTATRLSAAHAGRSVIEEMKCANCGFEFTFWVSLKQPSPFRYRCPCCKTRYRVRMPCMKSIVCGVVLLFACLTFGLLYGSETHGILFFAPFLILMIAIWLSLEFWTHNYIARNGQFTQISKDTEQADQP